MRYFKICKNFKLDEYIEENCRNFRYVDKIRKNLR